MRILSVAAITAVAIALSACNKAEPISRVSSNNPAVPASLLAQVEGCNIYRVYDGNSAVYAVICPNGDAQTKTTESCGKNCTRDLEAFTPFRQ